VWMSLKANPENFAELTERRGIIPPPYLARAKWIALESQDSLPAAEIAGLLRESTNWCWPSCPGSCAKPCEGAGGKNKRKSEARGQNKKKKMR